MAPHRQQQESSARAKPADRSSSGAPGAPDTPFLARAKPALESGSTLDHAEIARKIGLQLLTKRHRNADRRGIAVADEALVRIPIEVVQPVRQIALDGLNARQVRAIER